MEIMETNENTTIISTYRPTQIDRQENRENYKQTNIRIEKHTNRDTDKTQIMILLYPGILGIQAELETPKLI